MHEAGKMDLVIFSACDDYLCISVAGPWCPDMWSSTLSVSMSVFGDVLNYWWKFEGTDCPPLCGWALCNQLRARLDQKPDLLQARGNSAAGSLWT